jgi:hypothetical protein
LQGEESRRNEKRKQGLLVERVIAKFGEKSGDILVSHLLMNRVETKVVLARSYVQLTGRCNVQQARGIKRRGLSMLPDIENSETLSSDVAALCALLARILHRCLLQRDARIFSSAASGAVAVKSRLAGRRST